MLSYVLSLGGDPKPYRGIDLPDESERVEPTERVIAAGADDGVQSTMTMSGR